MKDAVGGDAIEALINERESLHIAVRHLGLDPAPSQQPPSELDVPRGKVDTRHPRAGARVPNQVDTLSTADVEDVLPLPVPIGENRVHPRRVGTPILIDPGEKRL
jgi:hypothetical protein